MLLKRTLSILLVLIQNLYIGMALDAVVGLDDVEDGGSSYMVIVTIIEVLGVRVVFSVL